MVLRYGTIVEHDVVVGGPTDVDRRLGEGGHLLSSVSVQDYECAE